METRARRHAALLALKVWDGLIALVALFAAGLYASPELSSTALRGLASEYPPYALAAFVAGALAVWHAVFAGRKLYESRRLEGARQETADVLRATGLATALLALCAVLGELPLAQPAAIVAFWAVGTSAAVLSRLLMRVALAYLRARGRNLRDVLIVGQGPRGQALAKKLRSETALGYRLVGFVDDAQAPEGDAAASRERLGSLTELPEILSRTVVDEVFVALPIRSCYGQMQEVLRSCEEQGVAVNLLGDLFEARLAKTRVVQLGDTPTIRLYSTPESNWRSLAKRAIDVSASATALVVLAPLLLGVAAAIRSTSPGPALFRQERVGLNKRRFVLYKFRTMAVDAESRQKELLDRNEASGPVFKMRDDPRVTPLGRFLRRTSIDELPQLINVLKGDMSLVGPRPLPLRDVEGFRERWHRRRFSVLPGITCLWQLSGRSNVPFERWMELDLEYIDNWSLALDLKILLRTVSVVLRREGAY